jgi:MFS-type transporter involved in bile tolerance (Atg22 family)
LSKTAILNSKVIGWALYDWANSAFALSVLAVLFPLVLGNYWSVGDDGAAVTARLGWITFAASALVCLTAPLFGTIADAGGYRKRFLFVLAVIGATMTARVFRLLQFNGLLRFPAHRRLRTALFQFRFVAGVFTRLPWRCGAARAAPMDAVSP